MTGRLLHYLATATACLVALASANVTMAANLSTNHGADAGDAAAPAAAAVEAQPDPGNLTGFRDQVGKTLVFSITGTTDGSVYGDGVYTDDSVLDTAAVHAGIVAPGQSKDVTVQILPGQGGYKGGLSFGVTSSSYGEWPGSYKFLDKAMSEADAVFPEPGDLKVFRSKVGKILHFQITGSTTGSIWGNGVYTDDSDVDTAAVHAGVLKDGEDGVVGVKFLPGQGKYAGASRNGVDSQAYANWDSSYEFVDKAGNPILPAHK